MLLHQLLCDLCISVFIFMYIFSVLVIIDTSQLNRINERVL